MNVKACSTQFISVLGISLCVIFAGVCSVSCRGKKSERRAVDENKSALAGESFPNRSNQKKSGMDKPYATRKSLQSHMSEKEEVKKKSLSAIKEIDDVEDLRLYISDLDYDIRSAVVTRLGEIGTQEAVKMLSDAFEKEPRKRGTDVSSGIKGEVVNALARSGHENAKKILFEIITDSVEKGPLVKGPYSHIYDSQYYSILIRAIGALVFFPGSETISLLQSIAGDSQLFYSLREQAWDTLLTVEMGQKGLDTPKKQVCFLLSQMNSEGVFPEKWWDEPGKKSDSAITQTVIERLIEERGWDSVAPLLKSAESTDSDDYARKTAIYRMLSEILIRKIGEAGNRDDAAEQKKDVIGRILAFLENVREEKPSSSAISGIYKNAYSAARHLQDENVWKRIKRIHKNFEASYAWKGRAPSGNELGFLLPPSSVFIKSMSSQVEFKSGKIQRLCYFSDLPAQDLVAHFEKSIGKRAVEKKSTRKNGGTGTSYFIEFGKTPREIEGLLKFGVIVFEAEGGFEEKAFGEVVREGISKFGITRFVY